MSEATEVGRALGFLRRKFRVSQSVLSRRMGRANKASVSAIETGNPRSSSVAEYLSALGATWYDLADAIEAVAGRAPRSYPMPALDSPEAQMAVRLAVDAILEREKAREKRP